MNADELDGEIRRALTEIGDAAGIAPRFDQLRIDELGKSSRQLRPRRHRRLTLMTATVVVIGAGLWALAQVAQPDDALVSTAPITPAPATAADIGTEPPSVVADPSLPTQSTVPATWTDSTLQPATSMSPHESPIAPLAIGDSIMLGAAFALEELGLVVEAEETQTFEDVLRLTGALKQSGRLGDVVVIGLGMTGIPDAAAVEQIMANLDEVPNVFFLTFAGDRPWLTAYNELVRTLAGRHQNVKVIDWATKAGDCTGDCFAADGLHLVAEGREYYARIVMEAIAARSAD